MKLSTAALACLIATAPLAGQEDSGQEDRNVTGGFRVSAAIPRSIIDRDASFGAAFGLGFIAEWKVGQRVALYPSVEYLFLPTKEEYQSITNSQGQQVIVPKRSEGSLIKIGADLAFRPDGLWDGPFFFAGGGIEIMTISEYHASQYYPTATSKDVYSIAYVTFGAGYDFSRYFGVEVRYNNMLPSYEEKYKYSPGVDSEQQYSKIGDLNSIQVSVRVRF